MGRSIFRTILKEKTFCALLAFYKCSIIENIFWVVSYQKVNLGTASFSRERCLKGFARFTLS